MASRQLSLFSVGNSFLITLKTFCQPFRSSRREVFCKKPVVKNFAERKGKDLSKSLFLKKKKKYV